MSYLTGQKNLLNEEQKAKLRIVGLSHVVVASGYHLSIVINLAKKRFGKISRFATFAGAIAMLVLYVSITGFTPSMTRASLVALLSLWAWYFGRKFHPVRLILYAAAISLIIDAGYITNLAWQLSFASYSGILLLSPIIAKLLYGDAKPGYFASLIIASISAQIFCLPITIYNFGSISILAVLSNILVTPTIPAVMLLTFISGIVGVATPITFILEKLLWLQWFIIDHIATVPWASFEVEKNPVIFAMYPALIVLILVLKRVARYNFRPSYAVETTDYDKIYAC